jgi:hypothetical protein
MDGSALDRIAVACSCGAKLRVPVSAAGRRVKCPKCGSVISVPVPAPAMTTSSEPGAASGEDDWLTNFAAAEQAAAPALGASAAAALKPCPSCGATLGASAKLCTSCGYNLQTGRVAKGARTGPSAAGAATRVAKVAGGFVLGCVLSVVGAAIGAGIWYGIAIKSGYEIGYVAWGIGLATGFGMALGTRSGGLLPGIVAAAIALVAVLAAKALIFFTILYGAVTGDTTDPDVQKTYVAVHIAWESLRNQGIEPENATDQQSEAAFAEAKKRVERMDKATLQAEHARLLELASKEAKAPQAGSASSGKPAADTDSDRDRSDEATPDVDKKGLARGLAGAFFASMFGLLDVVFLLLAVGTAFKIGSRGLSAPAGES